MLSREVLWVVLEGFPEGAWEGSFSGEPYSVSLLNLFRNNMWPMHPYLVMVRVVWEARTC